MRRFRLLLSLLVAVVLAGAEPRVLLLSLDGLGADQVTAERTPKLWALAKEEQTGASVPPWPSTTFNGHATLATGCGPARHGIVGNSCVDPVLGPVSHASRADLLEREPLWVAATRSGVRTAVYHWVCGEKPWRSQAAWRQEPFRSGGTDRAAMAFCDRALAEGGRLVMAYLPGTDEEGHRFGPGSPEHLRRLREIDGLLAPWLEALRARHPELRIVFTADHGMVRVNRRISLAELLQGVEGTWNAHGRSATLTLKTPSQAPAVIETLTRAGLEAWPSAKTLPHPRAGQVLVQAPEGAWLSVGRSAAEAADEAAGRIGAHGSLRDEPGLRAFLMVLGAGKRDLGNVPMTQVAPTIAGWLGIPWSEAPEGRSWETETPPAPGTRESIR